MNLNLTNRDTSGVIIAFVKFKASRCYCMAPVAYWIPEWWNGYVDLTEGRLADLYFEFIQKFKISIKELEIAYQELIERNDEFELAENKPKLYIDFEEQYFVSYYQEQELERRMPAGWKGTHGEIDALIPEEYKYWNKRGLV
jgi:hypothetical protein